MIIYISIWRVWAWNTGFLDMWIADMLSQYKLGARKRRPNSRYRKENQRSSAAVVAKARYEASLLDRDTVIASLQSMPQGWGQRKHKRRWLINDHWDHQPIDNGIGRQRRVQRHSISQVEWNCALDKAEYWFHGLHVRVSRLVHVLAHLIYGKRDVMASKRQMLKATYHAVIQGGVW